MDQGRDTACCRVGHLCSCRPCKCVWRASNPCIPAGLKERTLHEWAGRPLHGTLKAVTKISRDPWLECSNKQVCLAVQVQGLPLNLSGKNGMRNIAPSSMSLPELARRSPDKARQPHRHAAAFGIGVFAVARTASALSILLCVQKLLLEWLFSGARE